MLILHIRHQLYIFKNKKGASAPFSVSKKPNCKFRHAGRLLRNGAEFRILRGKMYEGTSTEQKAKNAKSGLDSMSKPLLQSLRQRIRVATSLYTRGGSNRFI